MVCFKSNDSLARTRQSKVFARLLSSPLLLLFFSDLRAARFCREGSERREERKRKKKESNGNKPRGDRRSKDPRQLGVQRYAATRIRFLFSDGKSNSNHNFHYEREREREREHSRRNALASMFEDDARCRCYSARKRH